MTNEQIVKLLKETETHEEKERLILLLKIDSKNNKVKSKQKK